MCGEHVMRGMKQAMGALSSIFLDSFPTLLGFLVGFLVIVLEKTACNCILPASR